MHVTIDVILSTLDDCAAHARVLAREERLSLSGATTQAEKASSNTLLVTTLDTIARGATPQHALIVVDLGNVEEAESHINPSGFSTLAVIETALSLNELYARVCSGLLELSHWDARMLEAIAAHQDASDVLAIAAERLDNPIALFDSSGALLTYAGDVTGDVSETIWAEVLRNRYSPVEYYTREEQREIERVARQPWPFLVKPMRSPSHCNLSRALFVNGHPVGSVGLVDIAKPFSPAQIALVELVADRMRLALMLRLSGNGGSDDRSYLLRSLLNNDKVDKALVARHLERLGWKPGQLLTLFCFASPRGGDTDATMLMRLERMGRCLRHGISIIYNELIVTLCIGTPSVRDPRLEQLLVQLDLSGFMSEPYTDPLQSRAAFEQCQLTMRASSRNEGNRIVRFSDAFEHVVIEALNQELDRRALCDPTLLALARQGYRGDKVRGMALIGELYTYLMNGCNMHLSARQLFLHRNTLTYHIEQVEALLGTKLDELSLSRRLFLMFSCLVALDEGQSNL